MGLGGTELTALERAWLKLVRPGGVILFRRNIADADQTRALLNEATGFGLGMALRCVDVEGGTVNRLRDALAPIASAQAVAAAIAARNAPGKRQSHFGAEAWRADRAGGEGIWVQYDAGSGC